MLDTYRSIAEIENLKLLTTNLDSISEKEIQNSLITPIRELSNENLRQLATFGIYPNYVIPQAINILKEDPFAEGEYYKGDLLISLVGTSVDFLKENQNYIHEIQKIIDDSLSNIAKLNFIDKNIFIEALEDTIKDNHKIYSKSYFEIKNFGFGIKRMLTIPSHN